jgi:hypothetical protein
MVTQGGAQGALRGLPRFAERPPLAAIGVPATFSLELSDPPAMRRSRDESGFARQKQKIFAKSLTNGSDVAALQACQDALNAAAGFSPFEGPPGAWLRRQFTPSLCVTPESKLRLCAPFGQKGAHRSNRRQNMLDLAYLGLAAFLFALMGLYARACDRL